MTDHVKSIAEWGDYKMAQALLRFADGEETECKVKNGCDEYAIHMVGVMAPRVPLCATHSPFPNIYVPCTRCGEKPAEKPESIEEDPMCLGCIKEVIREVADRSMGAFTVVE